MTVEAWLQAALRDADRRGLPDLKPLLETLSRATKALRSADFNEAADGSRQSPVASRPSSHQFSRTTPEGHDHD
jgi:hypothetical protein